MQLAVDRLDEAMGRLAARVGLSKLELAEGVLAVANTTMERAIRVISVERGFDPREFTLFAFGGAGGMHAAYLARSLDIQRVMVPPNPGILSAIGMLMADVVKDYSLTVMLAAAEVDWTALKALFQAIERKGVKELIGEGLTAEGISLERFLDMRYQGQSYEIIVPFDEDYAQRFHLQHQQKYGYADDGKPIEIVNLRLRARGVPNKPAFAATGRNSAVVGKEAYLGARGVVFDHQPMPTVIFDREKLCAGNRLRGPAILVEYSSTVVLPPFVEGFVDDFGNVVMELD
jgi:N-methylhydantoinase A